MEQRVALVSGANRGIGRAVAEQLAGAGVGVVIGSRNLDAGRSVVSEIESGSNVVDTVQLDAVQLDVADDGSVARAVADVEDRHGRLDIVINNAAIHYDMHQRVDDADLDVVRDALDTNLLGAWRLTLAALPMLRRSGSGRIVNVSSGAGEWAAMTGSTPAYSISKLSLNGLTLMLAETLRNDGILVNAVCPGWVATDMGGAGGRPVADGAAGIVWAATLPDGGPTGQFFRDGQVIPW